MFRGVTDPRTTPLQAAGGWGKRGETPSLLWGLPCRIDDACGVCEQSVSAGGPSRSLEHGRQPEWAADLSVEETEGKPSPTGLVRRTKPGR
jgi:hypothetical protein